MTYYGSVRFYKQLIISFLTIVLIFPYVFSIYLLLVNNELQEQLYNDSDSSNNIDTGTFQANNSITLQNEDSILSALPSEKISHVTFNDSLAYQQEYKDLYAERKHFTGVSNEEKVAYLTFDDGPSGVTLDVLKILDEYNIKAAFFKLFCSNFIKISYVYEVKPVKTKGLTLLII